MIRFPHEIKGLLTKARRIRRKMKARTGRPATRGRLEKQKQSRKPRPSNRAGEEPRMRERRHSLLREMPQPYQPKLKKTMANSKKWTWGVQRLQAPRQTKTQSPPKVKGLRKRGQGERLEPAMRERPEEPAQSRKPRSSNYCKRCHSHSNPS